MNPVPKHVIESMKWAIQSWGPVYGEAVMANNLKVLDIDPVGAMESIISWFNSGDDEHLNAVTNKAIDNSSGAQLAFAICCLWGDQNMEGG